jgi:hypothetical protein
MKKKKDLLDEEDLYVDPRRMTKEDEQAISEFIRKHKKKRPVVKTGKRKRAA